MLAELMSDLHYRLRALFRRGRVEQELDQELRYHLEREAEKLTAQGLSAEEARRRARVAFGGVEQAKEASREGRGLIWLEAVWQDLRYAFRALGRNPVFTVGVILTLGLGIGANAAMFGIVDRLMFRPPPYLAAPERTNRVYLRYQFRGRDILNRSTEYRRYLDLAQWTNSFSVVTAFSNRGLAVGVGAEARERPVSVVSGNFFELFDAPPVLGRYFTAAEDTVPVGAPVAVLGYGYWQAQYGGRPDVLGQTVQVGVSRYTVIGVAPRGFVGLTDEAPPALFIPLTTYAGTFRGGSTFNRYYTTYSWGWLQVAGVRKPGVSSEAAQADLTEAYRRSWLAEREQSPENPGVEDARPTAIAGPVQMERGPQQSNVSKVAAWVSGVAFIVLLIACANVANLFLARALRRRREVALRLALGVSRRRLGLQLLTESLLLSGSGGLAGVLVGYWGGAFLKRQFLPDAGFTQSLTDARTLVFAAALAILAGVLTGLAPILQARRTDLNESLKAGARESGARRSWMRTGLLLVQGVLSVVLLVGAGLFVRSLDKVRHLRLGYDVDPVLYVSPNFRGEQLSDEQRAALAVRLMEAARTVPGVTNASLALTVPLADTWAQGLFVAGIDSVDRLGQFTLQAGSPEFFATMGTRVVRGRGFTADDRAQSPKVAVVSQAMAATLWPNQEPLGQCFRMSADTAPCVTVVGVAENIKQNSITDDPSLHYYLPIEQFNPASAVVFARTRGAAEALVETLRRELQPLMPGASYVSVTPMEEIVGPNFRSWQLGATMFLTFGGLALVLAAIGLYSVIAYDVAQRQRELGIRIAMGARLGDVVRLVMGDGLRFALTGVALGGVIVLVTGRWVGPLLYEQSPRDPLVLGVVSGALLAVAAVASALPTLRATRVDPTVALRTE